MIILIDKFCIGKKQGLPFTFVREKSDITLLVGIADVLLNVCQKFQH
jgi:hypothetical protein